MRRILTLCIVTTIALTATASAHTRTVLDDDDSPSPLDLVAAQIRHSDGRLKLHLRTYEGWADRTLEDRKNFIAFHFDLDDDPAMEKCVLVKLDPPDEGEEGPTAVVGGVYRNGCLMDQIADHPGSVSRHQANGLTVRLPVKRIGSRSFRWRAMTSYEEPDSLDCPEGIAPEPRYGTCTDFTRWTRHGT